MEADSVPKNTSSPAPDVDLLPKYTIPGILHFIQHEWTRFEMDRAHWEVERAELQAKIAFLQGERKGQENLKHDLIRRIKMLEYALKQERAKYHKLKFGTEPINQEDLKPPQFNDSSGTENSDAQHNSKTGMNLRQGRQLLRQYLQEIGYTDAILDVRSSRVRSLLGLTSNEPAKGKQAEQVTANHVTANDVVQVAASKPNSVKTGALPAKESNVPVKRIANQGANKVPNEDDVMSNFDFLQNEGDEDEVNQEDDGDDGGNADDESDDRDDDIMERRPLKKTKQDGFEETVIGDPEADQALAEFDFLVDESNPEISENNIQNKEATMTAPMSQGVQNENFPATNDEWGVDPGTLAKLKEQYKKERKSKKNQKRPPRVALQAMLANLNGEDDVSPAQAPGIVGPMPIKLSGGRALAEVPPIGNITIERNTAGANVDVNEPMPPGNSTRENVEDALGLGDLAGITVSNEADPLSYDVSNKDDIRRTWNPKFTLRSHFDAVRAICFHPNDAAILTGSEDHTVKLWNLNKTLPIRKGTAAEIEPIHTFRGHSGAILSIIMIPSGESCYTASEDATIRCWNLPSLDIDPYGQYDATTVGNVLTGHTNAVWDLAMHGQYLLSCSADATCRLWNPSLKSPLVTSLPTEKGQGLPTSIDFVRNEPNQIAASYSTSTCSILDTETGAEIVKLDSNRTYDNTPATQINKVVCHPTMGISITAHEDRYIRFFDNNTGKQIHSMVAHLDAVTCLSIDHAGLYLLSGSHDCSIRLWNLETRTCVQEITSHRKKFDESIYDVAFHPGKAFIASAGADGLAKVFV